MSNIVIIVLLIIIFSILIPTLGAYIHIKLTRKKRESDSKLKKNNWVEESENKSITTDREAREKLIAGVKQLASAVKGTLGPQGRNVILDKELGGPVITKDGVSVARDINLVDDIERIGCNLIKEVALRTSEVAGDGTSTSTLIAEQILIKASELVNSPVSLKKELDEAMAKVIEYIDDIKVDVDSEEQLRQIATISSNGDEDIGAIITEAVKQSGETGIITVETSPNTDSYIETKSGYEFDKGFMSPYFVNSATMSAEFDEAYVFLCKEELKTQKEFHPLLEKLSKLDKPTIAIVNDLNPKILNILVHNYLKDNLQVVAVKAPEYGDRQVALLEDMAAVTNGEVFNFEKGHTFKIFETSSLGKVDKAYISKSGTVLINNMRNHNSIQIREGQIKNELEQTTSDFDREKLQNRLAKLSGGVVMVYVGAESEVELKEKKDRMEDALHATRAAMEDGIVPGGGVALFRSREVVPDSVGGKILRDVLESPLRTIVANAGGDEDAVIKEIEGKDVDYGWNALTETYENFYESGVIDPAKVTKHALKNAVSVSGTLLTTNAVVTQPYNRLEEGAKQFKQ